MSEESPKDELSEGYGVPEPLPYIPYASPLPSSGLPSSKGAGQLDSRLPAPPSLLSVPAVSHSLPMRKKSRRRLWIVLGIIIVLLVVSVTSLLTINYINRPTPDKALNAFCTALQHGDYRSAYNQFSQKLQKAVSESAFAAVFSQDKVVACSYSASNDSQDSVATDLKLVHASKGVNRDVVVLVKDSNNSWKIDDVYKQA